MAAHEVICGTSIQAAFGWLDTAEARSQIARADLLQLVKDLQSLSLGTIPVPTDHVTDELDSTPDDFDRWCFRVVSRAIADMARGEDPLPFWQPVVDLGPYAHEFIEMFFWHWFIEGIQSTSPGIFMERWTEMIRYALASPHWKSDSPAFYRIDQMVFELMGYHFGESMADDERFAPLLEQQTELLAEVAQRWFAIPRVVNGFARYLTKPAYQQILRHGIEWIQQAVERTTPDDFRHERDFEANVIDALRNCWERHRERVVAEPSLRKAFFGLLTHLASNGSQCSNESPR